MMSIDEEAAHLLAFLKHPAGFDVGMGGVLTIRPIDESCPPVHWEVDWEENEDGMRCEYHKAFDSLEEAVVYYVEKRRYMCTGLDFEHIYLSPDEP